MRTECKVATLSLALLFGACTKRPDQTTGLSDDLVKDLAAASASAKDLTIVPQGYQRMRFVSDIEQSRASVPAQRPKISQRHDQMTASRQQAPEGTDMAPDPIASMASHAPAPASTPETPAAEPSIVIASRPSPEPASVPMGSTSEGGVGDGGHGGGLGGMLGGIIGAAVIRGGHAGVDKCDPRTDGRARPADRPDFGMPVPTGQVFGGRRR